MARQWMLVTVWLLLCVNVSLQDETCSSPSVTSNMYTTTDGMIVSDVAFIVELSVTCQNGAKDLSLYAVINGVTVPVVKSLDNNKYQFSWTQDPKNVQSGEQTLRIYDEEGFSALRKVQRSGEDTSNIKPLFTVTINHPGTYQGPWVQSELVAVVTALILWYVAYSTKLKIQL
ncbi:translocon-associated protein subunit delta-like [Limulus polyphemus]|uniref:Translocon-associated protein subunit delta n=1 Tax=Limulus polyphemus TaxID=6850 RepID=A0ABM1C0A8_LIMPO|nr:translocon-associated protein subunit delta-like [Limulus polyphemus]